MSNIFIIKNFLSKNECETILHKCLKDLHLNSGEVLNGSKSSRKSNIGWIEDLGEINSKLKNVLLSKININGYNPTKLKQFQFTEYIEGGFYDWHTDYGSSSSNRFYSTIIQLNDEYSGGELDIIEDRETYTVERGLGNLFLFPSTYLHRIRPITNGKRYSLVNWVGIEKINKKNNNLL